MREFYPLALGYFYPLQVNCGWGVSPRVNIEINPNLNLIKVSFTTEINEALLGTILFG